MSYQTLSGRPVTNPTPEDEPSINRLPKMYQAVQRFEREARDAREFAKDAARKAEDLTATAEKARAELVVAIRDELQLLTGEREPDVSDEELAKINEALAQEARRVRETEGWGGAR